MNKHEAENLGKRIVAEDPRCRVDGLRSEVGGYNIDVVDTRTGYQFVIASPADWDERVAEAKRYDQILDAPGAPAAAPTAPKRLIDADDPPMDIKEILSGLRYWAKGERQTAEYRVKEFQENAQNPPPVDAPRIQAGLLAQALYLIRRATLLDEVADWIKKGASDSV